VRQHLLSDGNLFGQKSTELTKTRNFLNGRRHKILLKAFFGIPTFVPSVAFCKIAPDFTVKSSFQRPLNPPEQPRLCSLSAANGERAGVRCRSCFYFCELVFPDPQHAPACPSQCLGNQPVTRPVAGEFVFPEGAVACWLRSVPGAAMPETAVHEECEPHLPENKIRTHGELMACLS